MKFDADDIEGWASEYPDAQSVQGLVAAIELDRRLPQPGIYPAGSPMRNLAEIRQNLLLQRAVKMGYKPAGKELVAEAVTEIAKSQLIFAAGLNGSATGDLLDKAPIEESDRAEKQQARAEHDEKEKRRERAARSPGQALGFERSPW